jgi:beta-glucosidase-like glycosyl hydrolase
MGSHVTDLEMEVSEGGANFSGFVMSDWFATRSLASPMSSLKAGLDIEMPGSACNWFLDLVLPTDFALLSQPAGCTHMTPGAVSDGINSGEISEADVDDSASRILSALFAIGEFDAPNTNTPDSAVSSSQHHAVSAQVAAAGTVLLKNKDSGGRPLLPIVIPPVNPNHPGEVLSIAVIGHEGLGMTTGGGGSGGVTASNTTSPINGIRVRMGLEETINPWAGAGAPDGAIFSPVSPFYLIAVLVAFAYFVLVFRCGRGRLHARWQDVCALPGRGG